MPCHDSHPERNDTVLPQIHHCASCCNAIGTGTAASAATAATTTRCSCRSERRAAAAEEGEEGEEGRRAYRACGGIRTHNRTRRTCAGASGTYAGVDDEGDSIGQKAIRSRGRYGHTCGPVVLIRSLRLLTLRCGTVLR